MAGPAWEKVPPRAADTGKENRGSQGSCPSHFTCFWSFHPAKIVETQGNLSAWKRPVRCGNVGQVPAGLFHRTQAIANQERLVHQKTEIIRL
jgi:hypothetical protein